MPLDGEAAVTGYFLRTEKWLKDLFGFKTLAESGVLAHSKRIGELQPAELLHALLDRCQLETGSHG